MTEWNLANFRSLDEANEAALAALEREQTKLAELTKVIEEENVTVRSKDRSLSMTFDGRGELTNISFNGVKYRSMAPAELAHLLVETIRSGRAQCVRKMADVMGESIVPGIDFTELATGKVNPMDVFEKLISPFVGDDFGSGVVGRATREPQGGK
ncbi:YbaB/EbfC family nucleoid-associated protein [Kutzneria kofuensis]|uniref:DNA-binding protein YbaB n=1 Tax=Kutzneria kofuensis TaxID=103725 RepID=A0A7W9NL26_9PSEU|nr:YbaB/EbfC family nucleoid-associated protein [Kutzneria kofuensis]MBB5896319.1 DNA-binding protein YbaB [Kutzneria kofuensis]